MHFKIPIKIIAPIALVAVGFLFTTCIKDKRELGGDIIPNDYNLYVGTAKILLPLQTKIPEDFQATSTSSGYVGAIRTEKLGLATFSFGVNYCPTSLKFRYGKDHIIKSCTIALLKNDISVANKSEENIVQNFHIYRMNRKIDTLQIYNSGLSSSDYIPQPIESGGLIYSGSDTLKVFLNDSFAHELLSASQWALDSSNHFIDEFKALLFTCDPPVGNGGRLNSFTVTGGYINLTVNYQPTWADGLSRKDTTFQYILGLNNIQNFSSYQSEELESEDMKETILVEGIGGIKPYINPVLLKENLDQWMSNNNIDKERLIIARARYMLTYTNPDEITDINYYYPAYLFPCYKYVRDDNMHSYIPIKDIYGDENNHGLLNRSLGYYYGDVSSWIQTLVLKDKSEVSADSDLAVWFCPLTAATSSSYYSASSNTTYTANTDTYVVGEINGPAHNSNPPYLEIIYTILPKNQ